MGAPAVERGVRIHERSTAARNSLAPGPTVTPDAAEIRPRRYSDHILITLKSTSNKPKTTQSKKFRQSDTKPALSRPKIENPIKNRIYRPNPIKDRNSALSTQHSALTPADTMPT